MKTKLNVPTKMKGKRGRACDSCWHRKIKCDRVLPACDWCKHHGLVCTNLRSRKPERPRTRETPIGNSNSALVCSEKSCGSAIAPDPSRRNGESSRTQAPHSHLPNIWAYDYDLIAAGETFPEREVTKSFLTESSLAFIHSYTRPSISSVPRQRLSGPCTNYTPSVIKSWQRHAASKTADVFVLPERDVLNRIINDGYSSRLCSVFPVIQRHSFKLTIDKVYSNTFDPVATACVLAFLAFASEFKICEVEGVDYKQESFKQEAFKLVQHVILQPPTVEGLATLVMLAICQIHRGNTDSVDTLLSMATNSIFRLGGHEFSYSHSRTLFWVCFVIDKELCLRNNRPSIIDDRACDLTLSEHQGDHFSSNSAEKLVFPVDLGLSIIKSQVYELLYSREALRETGAELLRRVRALDADLERWRLAQPESKRPLLSGTFANRDLEVRTLIVHLGYYQCVAKIHGATRRCQDTLRDLNHNAGIDSSLLLCSESCRSSLFLISTWSNVLESVAFWMVIPYSISALWTLLNSNLHQLLNPSGAHDRILISMVSAINSDKMSKWCSSHE